MKIYGDQLFAAPYDVCVVKNGLTVRERCTGVNLRTRLALPSCVLRCNTQSLAATDTANYMIHILGRLMCMCMPFVCMTHLR